MDGSPTSVNPDRVTDIPRYSMSRPCRASRRQLAASSQRSPLVVTPTICLAISVGSVVPASWAASALITTASYVSAA